MILSAAALDRQFIHHPQARGGLARVEDHSFRPGHRVHEAMGQRGDTRHASQKVERRPLRGQQAARLASDQGFQDSLNLYNSMPAAQVKRVFAGLDDQTVTTYLEAMQPRTAAKIIKEFKSQDETDRIQHILERMRTAQASATLKG